jgi:hypothetical protein
MDTQKINVEICTIPQAACDASKANWQQTAQMVSRQLKTKFGELVQVQHIEFMSPEWFQNEQAQKLLENGEVNFPFVLVNKEVACADKKINISKINKVIQTKINT